MTAFWSAIVNGAILSAALTIGVSIALRLTPRRTLNAATRYATWWIVLLATIALPLSFVQWPHRAAAPVYSDPIPLTDPAPMLSVVAVPVAAPARILPIEIPASPWLRPLLFTWIATALLLLLRLALSYATLYRRTARSTPAPPTSRFGARVACSCEIDIPMATGPFRRAILIPAKLFATIDETDLDQICRHEAAHLARRDDYTLFLQRIIEALFALHPVVRWITRQLDLEREIACDDAVASSADTARSYADCLTRMVQACGGVRPSLAAASAADSRSHLSRRVELLVRANRPDTPRLRHRPFALSAIALVCTAALLAKTPRLVAFATPHIAAPVVAQLRAEAPPPPQVPEPQTPVIVAQTTRPAPPPALQPPPQPAPPPEPPPQGPSPPEPPPQPPPPPPAPQLPLYILGANDVVGITVANDHTITGTYNIAPDGRLSLPLIHDFSAVGLTIPQLQLLITQKLEPFISDPVVNVQLLRNNSKKFTVIGDIKMPGPYPLLRQTTILDALAASGGFNDFANLKKIILRRGDKEFPFSYRDIIRGKHLEQNIRLEDGDIIIVREFGPYLDPPPPAPPGLNRLPPAK